MNSSVRKISIIGISRPSKFHGFLAIMDQKMVQSWSKTIKAKGFQVSVASYAKNIDFILRKKEKLTW